MIILLAIVAIFLTWWQTKVKNLLVAFCAALTWFGMAMWLFFEPVPLFGLTDTYQKILVWVFVLMAFVPFLVGMDTEIRRQMKDGSLWVDMGEKPKMPSPPTNYEQYREELQRRMGRLGSNGKRRY
jgi:hypothetical protein